MLREEVLREWESLEEKLTSSLQANQKLLEQVNFYSENKELIKEAVEAHQDYISHFLPAPFTAQKLADAETELKEALERETKIIFRRTLESIRNFNPYCGKWKGL